jgi:hypothetical protein
MDAGKSHKFELPQLAKPSERHQYRREKHFSITTRDGSEDFPQMTDTSESADRPRRIQQRRCTAEKALPTGRPA